MRLSDTGTTSGRGLSSRVYDLPPRSYGGSVGQGTVGQRVGGRGHRCRGVRRQAVTRSVVPLDQPTPVLISETGVLMSFGLSVPLVRPGRDSTVFFFFISLTRSSLRKV